ncbi:MAG: hypothetical protein V3T73_02945 [Dehalococcoidales bacterium]
MSSKENRKQNPNPPEELKRLKDRLAELEGLVTEKDDELASRNRQISKLEQAIADRDGEIASLKQSVAESDEHIKRLSDSLSQAVASYKALITSAHPQVSEELIAGDTIEAIDDSLGKAKNLVSKVRQGLEAEVMQARVPAGAPVRTPPDFSALSSREKIQYAIGGK